MKRAVKKEAPKLSEQVKRSHEARSKPQEEKKYDGDFGSPISTGSTLLDLAISGGMVQGGGLPGGILVEIFGPSSAGKTVLLCEIAGNVQRAKGDIMFHDPEARLNKTFARIFDFDTDKIAYTNPDTVTEVFKEVRAWKPNGEKGCTNGIFTDSLAALSTDLEMDSEDGDIMGMRRAKEFSEQLRVTARILTKQKLLMVCSNQIRENAGAVGYGEKHISPGGKAIGFYASLRLRAKSVDKIHSKTTVAGKEVKRVIGVKTEFEVYKSSIWKPFRSAPVYIIFDYGIDDVRANLQYIKDYTKNTIYTCGAEIPLDKSMEISIQMVEENGYEKRLRRQVIKLWEEIESKFETERKPKQRV